MAEAVVSPLLKQLAAVASDQFWRVLGVRSDLRKLGSELSAIQDVIQDAEERSVKERNVRNWVAKLKDAAYDVDDLLDNFQTMDAQWRQQDTTISNKVRVFFSPSNPLAFRIKMSSKIKAMVEKLDEIAKERSRYNFQPRVDPPSYALQNQTDTRTTFAVIDETSIYGRDDDVQNILKLLFEKDTDKEEEHLSVVTIFGMGGLGKTTLAQLVYKHERVVKKESFDKMIWVYVSDKFDIQRIATSIIESVTGDKCNLSELDPIINRVQQILAGKKFLLILDDVWNENQEEWDKVKGFLAVGAKGSKIVVTTRSGNIASLMGTSPYRLGVLSDDACWRLFEKRAFRSEDIQRDPSLEEIGREILAKCGGSPLAAKTLGSLMRSKTGREEWRAVRDSDIWRSTGEGNQVMASLKLSYNHLSPGLKQCFAYCCIFPKGTSINMDELVLHWIAMGFIPCNASLESAINKGKEIVKSLVWISFLDHEHLSRRFYKMHDLVHDLAKSVAGDEHFIYYADQKATIPQRCRFCTLVGIYKESELKDLFQESRKIRALRIEKSDINTSILFTSLPRLRVLDMARWAEIKEVHSSINRLKHLRYFRVGGNWQISELPNSIGGLHNLQALDASWCNHLRSVPESIGKLANLRTLKLSFCQALNSLPQSLGNLSNLEELDLQQCTSIVELPESIGKLANLRTIDISYSRALNSLPQSLGNLSNLEELDLVWCTGIAELPKSIGKLANLRTLKLLYCEALNSLPQSLGNLSNLEELDLQYCSKIAELPEGMVKMTNLSKLDLQYCSKIAELPEGMVNMTNLRHLRNEGMTSLRGMPLGIGKMRSLLTLELFVVGEGINHSSIAEMQHLNLIAGELTLSHLENVKSPEDAARANMKERHRLQRLCLRWSDLIPDDPYSIHEEVLAELIPHPNLEKLEISGYHGINFPNWVRMVGVSVPNLVELKLYGLKFLSSFVACLPPCLKGLHIGGIDAQTNLKLSGGGSFRLLQLEKLSLSNMPNLEEWFMVVAGVELYPRLEHLYISNCPKMHAEPCIPASVKRLELWFNSNEVLNSMGRAVQGVDLQGVSCGGALEELYIDNSNEMVDLPKAIRRFTSLRTLYIRDCPSLARLPEWLRELTSLKRLTIHDCHSSLKERCKEDTGEDWPIIAHIEQVYIV